MKNAVLGLVVERRGYGYDLVRRFNERFGAAWRLNQSTVYTALDRLAAEGYVRGAERNAAGAASAPATAPARQRIIQYEATRLGREHFHSWLTAPAVQIEPVRADIFLKIGLATQEHALALIAVIDAQIDACADALARHMAAYGLDAGPGGAVRWDTAAAWLINEAALTRLQSDLTWLRRVRAAAEALRAHGFVPSAELALARDVLPPGWR